MQSVFTSMLRRQPAVTFGRALFNRVPLQVARGRATASVSRSQRGFTLIEIMVVIVILGVLAAVVVPRLLSRPDEARVTVARQDIATLQSSLQLYRLDNGVYPSTEQSLNALVSKPTVGAIPTNWKQMIDKLPQDPWGRPYQYRSPGVAAEVEIWSLGADGQTGGEGVNADIQSWQLK